MTCFITALFVLRLQSPGEYTFASTLSIRAMQLYDANRKSNFPDDFAASTEVFFKCYFLAT